METFDQAPGTAMLDIQAEIAAEMARLKKTVAAPSGNKISTAGKQFKLPDGVKDPGPMTVVIIDYVTANSFYVGKFDRMNPKPPVCFAVGKEIEALAPVTASPDKQSENCTSCPMNQWGAPGQAKECKNTRLLAIVPPGAEEGSPIMTLSVAPKGLKGFDKYVADVGRQFGLPPTGVLTEISFDETVDFEKLVFRAVGPNENLKLHWGRKAEAMEMLLVEPDFTRGAQPASPPRGVAARPAAIRANRGAA
ncbi:MAG: hypothetical protein ACREA0_02380 [bacterium]